MDIGRNLLIGVVAMCVLALVGPIGFLIWANSRESRLRHSFESLVEANGPAAKVLRGQPSRRDLEGTLGTPSGVRSTQAGVDEEIVWVAGPVGSLTASFSAGRLRLMCYNGWTAKECVGTSPDDYRSNVRGRMP